jgi:hypothetical protein
LRPLLGDIRTAGTEEFAQCVRPARVSFRLLDYRLQEGYAVCCN